MDMLARRDARLHGSKRMIKLTDIESDKFDPNDPANGGVSYAKGMSAINAVHRDGRVIEGPQVFLKAYELVGLGWRPTIFFENGTLVPFCLSRRNIPELYTKRYRGTVFKKWLGYELVGLGSQRSLFGLHIMKI
eukprot:scaffold5228_cov131-Skeletonema_menzelii.AAC.6